MINLRRIKEEEIMNIRRKGITNFNELNINLRNVKNKVIIRIEIKRDRLTTRYQHILKVLGYKELGLKIKSERENNMSKVFRDMAMGKPPNMYKNIDYMIYEKEIIIN